MRSEDELLTLTRSKAVRIRRRWQASLLAGLSAVVVIAAGTLVALADDNDATRVVTADASTTDHQTSESSITSAPITTTTSTSLPPETTATTSPSAGQQPPPVFVVVDVESNAVLALSTATGELVHELARGSDTISYRLVAVSPDGTVMLIRSTAGDPPCSIDELVAVPIEGGSLRALLPGERVSSAWLSGDGSTLVFGGSECGSEPTSQLTVLNLAAGSRHTFDLPSGKFPSDPRPINPNGTRIALVGMRGFGWEIYDLDSGAIVSQHPDGPQCLYPNFNWVDERTLVSFPRPCDFATTLEFFDAVTGEATGSIALPSDGGDSACGTFDSSGRFAVYRLGTYEDYYDDGPGPDVYLYDGSKHRLLRAADELHCPQF